MSKRVTILGVPIDAVTMAEAVEMLQSFVESGTAHHVMTPNPEMIVEATKNPTFLMLLQNTSLNIPDGAGLLLAARILGECLPERVTGTDLVSSLVALPAMQPVFFLGAGKGVAERAATVLSFRYPALQIAGTFAGTPKKEDEENIVQMIRASGARTLLVAYGAPVQDFWIARVRHQLPDVRVAMGIGGAFDFIAGVRTRAPQWMQRFHLEWAWRFLQEPSRAVRIWRAVIVFPSRVLLHRLFAWPLHEGDRTV